MTSKAPDKKLARYGLGGSALMVLTAFAMAAVAGHSGIGKADRQRSEPVQTRTLLFEDHRGGAVAVVDPTNGQVIHVAKPGRDGFIRVVLRAFAGKRKQMELVGEPAFRLVRWADGRLTIQDLLNNHTIGLDGFSGNNKRSFAKLMNMGSNKL